VIGSNHYPEKDLTPHCVKELKAILDDYPKGQTDKIP